MDRRRRTDGEDFDATTHREGGGWFNLRNVTAASVAMFIGFGITIGIYRDKIDNFEKTGLAQEDKNRQFYTSINSLNRSADRTETIIPIMQSDIAEIKADMKQVLKAVKS